MDEPANNTTVQAVTSTKGLSWHERLLSIAAPIRAGEGPKVLALFYMLFMIMVAAYVLKPVREELILVQGGSEIKSYAAAVQALVLLGLIPMYGRFTRMFSASSLMLGVTLFFACSFVAVIVAGSLGLRVSVFFYVWLGAFGVLFVSQFWAYVSDFYDESDGKRLFGLVAFGASSGALVGSFLSTALPDEMNSYTVLSIGTAIFTLSIVPVFFLRTNTSRLVASTSAGGMQAHSKPSWLNGFRLIAKNRYLLWLAVFVLLANWVNSLGEYLVGVIVEGIYDQKAQAGEMGMSKNGYIRLFYGNYYLAYSLGSALIQFFLVSRCIKYFGVRISLLIVPVFTLAGYFIVVFFPIILLFKAIKIIENSLDYSLVNTVKQILYLPVTRQERYEARAVIESLCVRAGDVMQGLTVFIGLNFMMLAPRHFLWAVIAASIMLIFVVIRINSHYARLSCSAAALPKIAPR